MKKPSLSLLFCTLNAALLIGFAPSLMAQTTTWTGNSSNDWNTAGNWSNGLPGSSTPTPVISADGAVVNMSAAVNTRSTVVSGNGTTAPVLNITQNFTNNFSAIIVGSSTVNATGFSGTINHTAGTVAINGASGTRMLLIAAAAASAVSGNNGTYNFGGAALTAPVLNISTGLRIGARPGEDGVLTLSGYGNFSQGTDAAGVGDFDMSRFSGASTLNVIGGDLSINLSKNMTMSGSGAGSTILNATLTSSGFSTINVGGGVVFDVGTGVNNTTFNLSLDGFSGTLGQRITIINAGSAFTGHGVFGNVGDGSTITVGGYGFLADYDNVNHDFILEVAAIPEPSTWALLAVSLTALVIFRRRRAA
jgi:hypothetical protein